MDEPDSQEERRKSWGGGSRRIGRGRGLAKTRTIEAQPFLPSLEPPRTQVNTSYISPSQLGVGSLSMPSSTTPVPFLFGLVDSSTPLVFLLLPLVLLLPFSIFFLFKNSSDGSEPYVFEHIELNRLPGDPKSKKPETEWLNM